MRESVKTREFVYKDVFDDQGRIVIKGALFVREITETFVGVGALKTSPIPIVRHIDIIELDFYGVTYQFNVRKIFSEGLDYIVITPAISFGLLVIKSKAKLCLEESESGIVETWKMDLYNSFTEVKELYLRVPEGFSPMWIIPFKGRIYRESRNVPKYIYVKENVMYKPPTPNSYDNGDLCLGYSTTWEEPLPGTEIEFAKRFMNAFFNNAYNSDLADLRFNPVFKKAFGMFVGEINHSDFHPILNEGLHNLAFAV